jgi:chromosome segregation ATPase
MENNDNKKMTSKSRGYSGSIYIIIVLCAYFVLSGALLIKSESFSKEKETWEKKYALYEGFEKANEQRIAVLKADIAKLTSQSTVAKISASESNKMVIDRKSKLSSLEKKYEEKEKQIASATSQYEKLRAKLEDANVQLQSHYSLNHSNASLKNEYASLVQKVSDLKIQASLFESKVNSHEQRLKDKRHLINSVQELEYNISALKNTEKSIQSTISELDVQKKSLQNDVDSLISFKSENVSEKGRLEEEVSDLNDQQKHLTHETKTLKQKVQGLQERYDDLSNINRQVKDLQNQTINLQQKKDSLESDVKIKYNQVKKIASDRDHLSIEIDQLNSKRTSFVDELNALEKNIYALQGKEQELKKTEATILSINTKIIVAKETIAELEDKKNTVQGTINRLEGNLEKVEAGLTSLNKESGYLDQKYKENERDLQLILSKIDEARKELVVLDVTQTRNN